MKNYLLRTGLIRAAMFGVFVLGGLLAANMVFAATLNVNKAVACGGAGQPYCTIGAAIAAAAPGDTVKVAAGTYPEQLTITKALTLIGVGTKTIIAPATVAPDTTSYTSGNQLSPIILAKGTIGVNIENLEVNGATAGAAINSCARDLLGIVYQDTSGSITGATVTNVEMSPAYFGCQAGLAIYVQSDDSGGASNVNIQNNTVNHYDKNGITCNETGTNCTINNNTVTGIGQTVLTAQNGIQIAYGGTGSVTNNTVSGDSYTGTTPAEPGDTTTVCPTENYFSDCYQSAGVLLYDVGPGVYISNNRVSLSDVGVLAAYDPSTAGEPVNTTSNILLNNYGYGIVYDSVTGTSQNNLFQNNPAGLLVTDYSANATVTSINDEFLKNAVNNEALEASPGSTLSANIIVETTGLPIHLPFPGSHKPHFPQY